MSSSSSRQPQPQRQMIHATMQCPVLHRACQIGKWAATSPTSGWSARAARWRASSWQLPEKIFPGQSRKWIKQERRLPGRRERCDRQRAVSLLLLVTFSHPPLPCMVGLVFSLLQLRRGRVRSARSRASLLVPFQALDCQGRLFWVTLSYGDAVFFLLELSGSILIPRFVTHGLHPGLSPPLPGSCNRSCFVTLAGLVRDSMAHRCAVTATIAAITATVHFCAEAK